MAEILYSVHQRTVALREAEEARMTLIMQPRRESHLTPVKPKAGGLFSTSGKVLELVERSWRAFPPVGSRVVCVQMMKASVFTN